MPPAKPAATSVQNIASSTPNIPTSTNFCVSATVCEAPKVRLSNKVCEILSAFTSFPYFLRLRPAHIPALFPVSGRCPSPHRLSALSACKGIKVIVSVPHTAQNQSCYFFLYGTVLLPEVLPVSPPEPLRRSHIPELRLIPFLFCACWNIV